MSLAEIRKSGSNSLHITRRLEKLEKVREYLATPRKERMPLPTFRRETGIRRNEFVDMKRDIEIHNRELASENIKNIQNNLMKGLDGEDLEEDPVGWWKQRTLELNEAILESAKKGNAQSQKLAKQLAGELVEKQEVRIGLSADELTRLHLQAERELREGGFIKRAIESGVGEMSGELPLLSEDLRLHPEQEHGANG